VPGVVFTLGLRHNVINHYGVVFYAQRHKNRTPLEEKHRSAESKTPTT
jgi:hypothetical protein